MTSELYASQTKILERGTKDKCAFSRVFSRVRELDLGYEPLKDNESASENPSTRVCRREIAQLFARSEPQPKRASKVLPKRPIERFFDVPRPGKVMNDDRERGHCGHDWKGKLKMS